MIERFHSDAGFDIEVLPRGASYIVLASGLAKGLGHRDARDMVRHLGDDEKGYASVPTLGGDQRAWYVTEPGFYRVLGQRQVSRIKDPAVREQVAGFQRWIFHDVLPSLRQHGHYSAPVPGNLAEPVVLTWEKAAAHLRQRYGLPVEDAVVLRERLTDVGVLKLTGTPRKEWRDLFWPTGSRFDIHAHALPILAGRLTQALYELAAAQAGVQTALELDAIGRAALEGGTR
ncbi:Bro-N domain-containing protein [Streptomyces roseoverticillatus]|uniref:BRO-N domain-containing protein n=1 Tax=Streptomyces roseoverticillatus TaxID=66429 RepID=UPI001F348EEA|nr:Bro-N domain-containing protein [Streptomyces roseoverticillatus]MCF3101474.1 Bro-N domain-containing protein [Streptomyces roseoverticillatus]